MPRFLVGTPEPMDMGNGMDMKKIPSLFEIQTFAPGSNPRGPAPPMSGPRVPFYDRNGPPHQQGSLMGPGPQNGPLLPGPPPMRPPMGQGPQNFYSNYYDGENSSKCKLHVHDPA